MSSVLRPLAVINNFKQAIPEYRTHLNIIYFVDDTIVLLYQKVLIQSDFPSLKSVEGRLTHSPARVRKPTPEGIGQNRNETRKGE